MKGQFEAKKHAYRQTQDGVVISFVVHPSDVSPELAAAALGTIFSISYSDEDEDTSGPLAATPAAPTPPPEEVHQAPAKQRHAGAASHDKVVARAAILCGEPEFQRWLVKQCLTKGATELDATQAVRDYCGVASRRDLAIDGDARKRFLALVERYEMDTGRRAWVRPDDRRQTA